MADTATNRQTNEIPAHFSHSSNLADVLSQFGCSLLVSDQLWVVNTLFSCLATIEPGYSFVPRDGRVWLLDSGRGAIASEPAILVVGPRVIEIRALSGVMGMKTGVEGRSSAYWFRDFSGVVTSCCETSCDRWLHRCEPRFRRMFQFSLGRTGAGFRIGR